MSRPFEELRAKMSPEARTRSGQKANVILLAMKDKEKATVSLMNLRGLNFWTEKDIETLAAKLTMTRKEGFLRGLVWSAKQLQLAKNPRSAALKMSTEAGAKEALKIHEELFGEVPR